MISYNNALGRVSMTNGYFAELVSHAAQSGFGVTGMAAGNMGQSLIELVYPNYSEKGVRVTEEDGKLIINLHLKVSYGINIATAVQSVSHRVQYVVEEATGLKVRRINVSVDDIIGNIED